VFVVLVRVNNSLLASFFCCPKNSTQKKRTQKMSAKLFLLFESLSVRARIHTRSTTELRLYRTHANYDADLHIDPDVYFLNFFDADDWRHQLRTTRGAHIGDIRAEWRWQESSEHGARGVLRERYVRASSAGSRTRTASSET
jgi:hypothetical protein